MTRTRAIGWIAAGMLACGIDESGLEPVDASPDAQEAGGCATLDAACLGALPSSWKPVSLTDAGCRSGFTKTTLVGNPRVLPSGCACGACQVIGSYDCDAASPISGGNNCNDNPIAYAPLGQCTTATAQHLKAHVIQATGSVGCFAPNDAGAGAAGDAIGLCVPGCTADFCSAPSQCAIAEGQVACPTGMSLFGYVGTDVDPGCASCACTADPPGSCGGIVTGYQSSTCDDSGIVATYPVGSCNTFPSGDYASVLVTLTPPPTTCSVVDAAPDPGDASLIQAKTLCCR